MDKICEYLEDLLAFVHSAETLRIPYVGMASGRFDNPPATHVELCYVLEGNYHDLRIGGREVSLLEGQFCIHGVQFGNHSPAPRQPTSAWCAFVDVGNALPAFAAGPQFAAAAIRAHTALDDAFGRLRLACHRSGPPARYPFGPIAYGHRAGAAGLLQAADVKVAVMTLLTAVLRDIHRPKDDAHLPPQLEAALAHIHRHYRSADLELGDLADRAHLSIDHFGRLFRERLGTTPMRYLKHIRLEQSIALLRQPELRIQEIAQLVGFPDPLHYSREFRREYGDSPSRYRKQMQTSNEEFSDVCKLGRDVSI